MEMILTLILALLTGTVGSREANYASMFAMKGDIWMGGPSPCLYRMVEPDDNIIAHRTLPCGTTVHLFNPRTGKGTIAKVGERGPYGACLDEGWVKGTPCREWVVKKKASDPGIWRGAFDLTPRVGKAIGLTGIQPIIVTPIWKKNNSSKIRSKPPRPIS